MVTVETKNVERLAGTHRGFTVTKRSTSTMPTPQNNPTGRLQYLCNKYGNFKVARAWKDTSGELRWSKHRSVLECWESEWGIQWLTTVNNRQILPCEIVIDLDDKDCNIKNKMNWICDKLDIQGISYASYFTGSKGYHIHIIDKQLFFMNTREREKARLKLIEAIGADTHKKDEVMIALENVPHWKTGIKKEIVRQNKWVDF